MGRWEKWTSSRSSVLPSPPGSLSLEGDHLGVHHQLPCPRWLSVGEPRLPRQSKGGRSVMSRYIFPAFFLVELPWIPYFRALVLLQPHHCPWCQEALPKCLYLPLHFVCLYPICLPECGCTRGVLSPGPETRPVGVWHGHADWGIHLHERGHLQLQTRVGVEREGGGSWARS